MKKNRISILVMIVLSLIITSCDPMFFEKGRHSFFRFENKSNFDIVVDNDFNNPSTTICMTTIDANDVSMIVYANSTNTVLGIIGAWEGIFHNLKNDTMRFFIFDYKKALTYNTEYIPFDSVLLQHYDLTIKDLDKLNWTLSYPPSDAMKDVKMYPPYEE
jgi:hypothetical protein